MRTARAGVTAAAIAAVFIALEISLTGAWSVMTRPLWLDEIHTLVVAGRGDFGESIRALRAGAEVNAPTLFLLYRLLGALTGGLSEVSMRLLAAVSVVTAVAMVFLLLRDEFDGVAAAAGALALWAQPLVVSVAFNARFYGPWLAGAAALLIVVRRVINGPPSRAAAIALAMLSAFVCTIHYFGILSWGAGVGAAIGLTRRDAPNVVRRLIPAIAGPLALAACVPLFLGQRAALSNATWVPKASVADHLFLLVATLAQLCVVVALAAWAASRLVGNVAPPDSRPRTSSRFGLGAWLLLSQATVAFAVVIVSLVVQPATQPRYWIPASLAVPPIVALAVSRSLRPLQFVTVLAIVSVSVGLVSGEGADARAFAAQVSVDSTYAVRAATESSTIVVRRRHTLYPMLRAVPQVGPNAMLFGGRSIGPDSNLVAIDLRVASVHERFYGFPRIATESELKKLTSFYFVELDSARSPSTQEFPGRSISRIAPRLFWLR